MVDIVPERRKRQAGMKKDQGIGEALLMFSNIMSQMQQMDKSQDLSPDSSVNELIATASMVPPDPYGSDPEQNIAAIAAAQNKSVEGERKKRMDAPFRPRDAHEEGSSPLVPRFRLEEDRGGPPFGPHHLQRRNWNSYRYSNRN
jgi:hypothetical protein